MTERVTVDHNGERITLDVPDGTTDEQIKAFVAGGSAPASQAQPQSVGVGPVAPTYVPGQTGLAELGRDVVGAAKPLVEAGKDVFAGYAKSPGKAIVDIGAAHLGVPPPYAAYEGYQGVKNMLGAAKETAKNIGDVLGQLPKETVDRIAPNVKYFEETLKPGSKTFDQFKTLADKVGIERAISQFQYPEKLLNNPEFMAAKNEITGIFPTLGEKIGRVVGPILHGASKIAGPAVAAYEGAQGVNQARQGDYTGAGLSGASAASMLNPIGLIAQPGVSMMQSANQNFRQQTPQQQQESAMSALSGTAPGMSGEGAAFLGNNLDMAIRLKAAKKVLGQ